jgi:hypothetical protein
MDNPEFSPAPAGHGRLEEPDVFDLLHLPKNLGVFLFPYEWQDEYFVAKKIRNDGGLSCVLVEHSDYHHKNDIWPPVTYYVSVTIAAEKQTVNHWFINEPGATEFFNKTPQEIEWGLLVR